MNFEARQDLSPEEMERGLRNVLLDGLASQAMATLTGGVFLVGLAIQLNASNLLIGVLAAIPSLTQLLQIPTIALVERIRLRRKISFVAATLARLSLLIFIAAPLMPDAPLALTMLIYGLLAHTSFSAVSQCAWSSWMRDLVPQERLGRFYAKRMFYVKILTILLSIAAGYYIDWSGAFFNSAFPGYAALFAAGFVAGIASSYFIYHIPEPRMAPSGERRGFVRILSSPFHDQNFRRLIWFIGAWNFAVNLAAPFFTVYMITKIGLDMSMVIWLSVLSQAMFLVFIRVWGRYVDTHSNKLVLLVAGPVYLLCIFAWTFTTLPDIHSLTLPLLIVIHAFKGMANAGVTIASSNISRKLSPEGAATSYLAAASIINSLAAGVAPIVGGLFADYFSRMRLSLTFHWSSPGTELDFETLAFTHWDFFFFFAFVLGGIALYLLTFVEEKGLKEERLTIVDVVSQMMRDLRNFSTIGGLRSMVQFPFYFIRSREKK